MSIIQTILTLKTKWEVFRSINLRITQIQTFKYILNFVIVFLSDDSIVGVTEKLLSTYLVVAENSYMLN